MDDLTQLNVEIADHVATLTMNAPPVNALTRVLNDELTLALDRISEMDDVRVVILTGAGKVFCAGADLKGRAEMIRAPGTSSRIRAGLGSAFTPSASVQNRSSSPSTGPRWDPESPWWPRRTSSWPRKRRR